MHASHALISGADHRLHHQIPIPTSQSSLPNRAATPLSISFRRQTRPSSFTIKASSSPGVIADDARSELSFYELLGIPESGSLVEIKDAYRQLVRKYHPDVSPPGLAEEYTQRFIRVQEAYETLVDPGRRALYDRDMARGIHLAFSARRRYSSAEDLDGRDDWKNQWQSQLMELKRRSMSKKDDGGDMSWGARMRRQRSESSME